MSYLEVIVVVVVPAVSFYSLFIEHVLEDATPVDTISSCEGGSADGRCWCSNMQNDWVSRRQGGSFLDVG